MEQLDDKLAPGGASTARSLYNTGFFVMLLFTFVVGVAAVVVVVVVFVALGRGVLRIEGGSSSES